MLVKIIKSTTYLQAKLTSVLEKNDCSFCH